MRSESTARLFEHDTSSRNFLRTDTGDNNYCIRRHRSRKFVRTHRCRSIVLTRGCLALFFSMTRMAMPRRCARKGGHAKLPRGRAGGGEREAKVRYGHIRHQIRYLCRNLLSTKPVSKFLRNDTHGGHARSTRACGGGVLDIMLGRSRMVIDPRISTMPGRSTSSLHRPGRLCLHLARSAVRRSASRMKGKLHPVDPKNRL